MDQTQTMLKRLIKMSILLVFIGFCQAKGQELDSLVFVYQTMLDNPEFVEEVKNNQDLFCGSTLYYRDEPAWEKDRLTFNNRELVYSTTDSNCAVVEFETKRVKERKYEIACTVTKWFPSTGCQEILWVRYSAVLKTQTKKWKFRREKVVRRHRLYKFL